MLGRSARNWTRDWQLVWRGVVTLSANERTLWFKHVMVFAKIRFILFPCGLCYFFHPPDLPLLRAQPPRHDLRCLPSPPTSPASISYRTHRPTTHHLPGPLTDRQNWQTRSGLVLKWIDRLTNWRIEELSRRIDKLKFKFLFWTCSETNRQLDELTSRQTI